MLLTQDMKALDSMSADVTPAYIEKIAPYLALCSRTHEITSDHHANMTISKLSEGLSLVSSYIGAVSYLHSSSKFKRKQEEARAALEKAPMYAEKTGQKMTESKLEHFVNLDLEVQAAMDKENMSEAMLVQLNIIKMNIIMSLSAVKASRYGFKDDGHTSGSLV